MFKQLIIMDMVEELRLYTIQQYLMTYICYFVNLRLTNGSTFSVHN